MYYMSRPVPFLYNETLCHPPALYLHSIYIALYNGRPPENREIACTTQYATAETETTTNADDDGKAAVADTS